jgi:adenosine/AMP kinase
MGLEFECIPVEKDEATSATLEHAGFIKTVEDLYEAMACSVPGLKVKLLRFIALPAIPYK